MRTAIGVGSHFFQKAYAVVLNTVGDGDSHSGVILMIARPFYFKRLVVEEKAFRGVVAERTEACSEFFFVNRLSVYRKSDYNVVEIGVIYVPKLWIGYDCGKLYRSVR